MATTIRINQKHVERFIFIVIIVALLGLYLNEKLNSPGFNETIEAKSGKDIDVLSLLPSDDPKRDSSKDDIDKNNTPGQEDSTNDAEGESSGNDSTTITTTTQTTSTSSTTSTSIKSEVIFTIEDLDFEIQTEEDRAKVTSIQLRVVNNLGKDLDLTVRYYLFDINSDSMDPERTISKKPDLYIGKLEHTQKYNERLEINKYVFGLGSEKVIRLELVDSNKVVLKEITKTFSV